MKSLYYITKENKIFDNIKIETSETKFGTSREIQIIDGKKVLDDEPGLVYSISYNDFDRSSVNKEQLRKLALDILKSLRKENKHQPDTFMDIRFTKSNTETLEGLLGDLGKLFIHYLDGSIEVVCRYWELFEEQEGMEYLMFDSEMSFLEYTENCYEPNYWIPSYSEDVTNKPIGKAVIKYIKDLDPDLEIVKIIVEE